MGSQCAATTTITTTMTSIMMMPTNTMAITTKPLREE